MTKCKKCKYYVVARGGEGECRRKAPIPGSGAQTTGAPEMHLQPVLVPEGYSCGDGQPKR